MVSGLTTMIFFFLSLTGLLCLVVATVIKIRTPVCVVLKPFSLKKTVCT